MQITTIESPKTAQFFWLLIGLLIVLVAFTGRQTDPGIAATGVVLVVVSIFPLYLWLLGWSHGLPIWPIFALSNGITGALPMLQDLDTLEPYTPSEIIVGGMTIAGFLLFGTILWIGMTSRPPSPPRKVLAISQEHAVRYLLIFIGLGIVFSAGLLRLPGNLMQLSRGVFMSLSLMSVFILSFYHGRGILNRRSFYLMLAGLISTVAMNLTSLMLAQGFVPVAMGILGYMLGSGKLPWRVLMVAIMTVTILHPGKYEMRNRYWGGEATGTLSMQTLPKFYVEWFMSGLNELGGFSGVTRVKTEEDKASSAFERGGNVHMLLMVQKKSPNEVPFCNGATYEPIPRLLVPRFIDSQKGISHAGNQMLSVNYGMVELENVNTVSIGWGLITEAYANFGYAGVAGLAVFLAIYYSIFTRFTVGVPMTSMRFVLGLLAMASATAQDTMGIFITSQFQGMVGVSLASFFLMRRLPNPYATAHANSMPWLEAVRPKVRVGRDDSERLSPARGQGADEQTRNGRGAREAGPAKWGGHRPPKWAPLSHRKAFELAAARRQAEAEVGGAEESKGNEEKARRPRQVAVPIQPYYYRSRKA